jgi:hypothetical protein
MYEALPSARFLLRLRVVPVGVLLGGIGLPHQQDAREEEDDTGNRDAQRGPTAFAKHVQGYDSEQAKARKDAKGPLHAASIVNASPPAADHPGLYIELADGFNADRVPTARGGADGHTFTKCSGIASPRAACR